MTNQNEHRIDGPLDMASLSGWGMAIAVSRTIAALNASGELDQTDMATAKLALEVAKRIDRDGDSCGVSLYNRLHSLLLDLQHVRRAPSCPLAQGVTEAAQEG